MTIIIKTEDEIAAMRQAGRIVAMILKTIGEQIRPGMETKELDTIAATELEKRGGK